MTWNIHGGVGPDGRHDLERIAALIRQVDPYALVLQEVTHAEPRMASMR